MLPARKSARSTAGRPPPPPDEEVSLASPVVPQQPRHKRPHKPSTRPVELPPARVALPPPPVPVSKHAKAPLAKKRAVAKPAAAPGAAATPSSAPVAGAGRAAEPVECGVCFDAITVRGQLDSCDHAFCFECITNWAKVENTCPHCKARFKSLKKITAEPPDASTTAAGGKKKRVRAPTVKVARRNQGDAYEAARRQAMLETMQSQATAVISEMLGFRMVIHNPFHGGVMHIRSGPYPYAAPARRASAGVGGGTATDPVVLVDSDDEPAAGARAGPGAVVPVYDDEDDEDEEDEDYNSDDSVCMCPYHSTFGGLWSRWDQGNDPRGSSEEEDDYF